MTRKLLITGIALIGFTLALGNSAWAGQGKGGNRHQEDGQYHQTAKEPSGHHYGWEKGKKNPHKPRFRDYPVDRHRDDHRRPVIEKHVYHHYQGEASQDDGQFNVAVSLIENAISIAVAVSRTY